MEDSEDTGSEDMEDAEYMEESSDEEWDADDEQVASFTARQFFLQLTNSLPRKSEPAILLPLGSLRDGPESFCACATKGRA